MRVVLGLLIFVGMTVNLLAVTEKEDLKVATWGFLHKPTKGCTKEIKQSKYTL